MVHKVFIFAFGSAKSGRSLFLTFGYLWSGHLAIPRAQITKVHWCAELGITEGLPKTQDPNHHLQWALRRLTVEEVGTLANIQMDSFFIFTAALPAEVLCNVREKERERLKLSERVFQSKFAAKKSINRHRQDQVNLRLISLQIFLFCE